MWLVEAFQRAYAPSVKDAARSLSNFYNLLRNHGDIHLSGSIYSIVVRHVLCANGDQVPATRVDPAESSAWHVLQWGSNDERVRCESLRREIDRPDGLVVYRNGLSQ